jgi:ABC-2 type transport system permease protein
VSAARFPRLLAAELRLILRERLTWAILAGLVAALCLAAWTGAGRVAAERAALAAAAADGERAVREAKAAHLRYGQPAAITVNYWQDPTDAFGYMSYFMAAYAVKPPTPLAVLAAGQSDVQPAVTKIGFGFSTVFDDTATEIGSAAALRLGPFDLAFVLVILLPLAIIALAGTRLSSEHDSGILRMIAAQPTRPRHVAGAKFAAAALVAVAGVLGGTVAGLWLSGGLGDLAGWWGTAALLAAALAAYVVFWVAACALAASLWRGAVAALAALVLAWACLTIALPTALGLAIEALAPAPSRIAAIDASRQAQARFYAGDEARRVTAAWLAATLPADARRLDLADRPELKRLARDATYDAALADHRAEARAQALAAAAWSRRLALLSPATAFALALETAAGTDAGRHAEFLAASADYRRGLRSFFEPRILAQALSPAAVCAGCPARLDFDAYDAVPAFAPADTREAGGRQALLTFACLAVATLLLVALAFRRLTAWPA